MKIVRKEKLLANWYYEKENSLHIKTLKQTLAIAFKKSSQSY